MHSPTETKSPGTDVESAKRDGAAGRFRFTIRTMLALVLVAAAFFAGRFGDRLFQSRKVAGSYLVRFVSGAEREAVITHLGDDQFQLQGCGVLNGIYVLKDERLAITKPVDQRMVGLVWKRTEPDWRLIGEPAGTPTGSSYIGAMLKAIPED